MMAFLQALLLIMKIQHFLSGIKASFDKYEISIFERVEKVIKKG